MPSRATWMEHNQSAIWTGTPRGTFMATPMREVALTVKARVAEPCSKWIPEVPRRFCTLSVTVTLPEFFLLGVYFATRPETSLVPPTLAALFLRMELYSSSTPQEL